jgi:hypothetical protein
METTRVQSCDHMRVMQSCVWWEVAIEEGAAGNHEADRYHGL